MAASVHMGHFIGHRAALRTRMETTILGGRPKAYGFLEYELVYRYA